MKENTKLNLSAIDYNNGLVGYEIPGGYEFDTVIDNKIIIKKLKPKYPKTYAECCEIMQVARPTVWFSYDDVSSISEKGDEYENHIGDTLCVFRKLLICRDAYWKIAGEQMGLGKPWEPDWNDLNRKYFISLTCDGIGLYDDFRNPQVLVFPTEEMRDGFYENFKDLIEQCKELL